MCVGAQRPDVLESGACVRRCPEARLSLEAGAHVHRGKQAAQACGPIGKLRKISSWPRPTSQRSGWPRQAF